MNKKDFMQFKTIFLYEFFGIIKNKTFIITTLVIALLIGGVLTSPTLINLVKSEGTIEETKNAREDIAILNFSTTEVDKALNASIESYNFISLDISIEDLKDDVNRQKYYAGLIVTDLLSFDLYVKDYSMTSNLSYQISEVLTLLYKTQELKKHGLSDEETLGILTSYSNFNLIELGKSGQKSFLFAYLLLMFLYIAVNLYGQLIASSVAMEKSSRAMELLISSAKPLSFMFGKIMGSALAGLSQFLTITLSSLFFFKINEKAWLGQSLVLDFFNMPLSVVLYAILFFLLGFFLFAFMYGAVGSLVSRIEDINTSILPITFLYMVGFLVSMGSITSPNNLLLRIFSFIPFFAPMSMFLRIVMTSVPLWQIILSVSISLISIVLIGGLAAKVYRVGVLMYGKPPKIKELINVLKSQE